MMSERLTPLSQRMHASGFVETENAIETAAVDQFTASVEAGIAVAAAEAIGKQGTRRRRL